MILGQRSVSDNVNRSSVSEGDHDTKKSWSRSRTLSITAGPSAVSFKYSFSSSY